MVSMSIRLYLLLTVADTEIKLVMEDVSRAGYWTTYWSTSIINYTSNTSIINSPPPTPLL